MSTPFEAYVEAAMIGCPRCNVAVGKPCVVLACRNGRRGCTYKVCAYWQELAQPHLERAVKARQAAQ